MKSKRQSRGIKFAVLLIAGVWAVFIGGVATDDVTLSSIVVFAGLVLIVWGLNTLGAELSDGTNSEDS